MNWPYGPPVLVIKAWAEMQCKKSLMSVDLVYNIVYNSFNSDPSIKELYMWFTFMVYEFNCVVRLIWILHKPVKLMLAMSQDKEDVINESKPNKWLRMVITQENLL